MSTLKQLRLRINGVKSTEKITKAMKMVAASKLHRAQAAKDALKPYANKMYNAVAHLANSVSEVTETTSLITGTGKDDTVLLVVAGSDKGLCGAFNSSLVRKVKEKIIELENEGKKVKLWCIGEKVFEQLKTNFHSYILEHTTEFTKGTHDDAHEIALRLIDFFNKHEFDTCYFCYVEFKNALKQEPTSRKIIPLNEELKNHNQENLSSILYEYEPNEAYLLNHILPMNLTIQIYYMMLESIASEHGARMSAMDSATKNAKEMIADLTLEYNRSRQAAITSELIEIVSSAEVL